MVKQKKGKKDQAREESAADATDEQLDVDVDEDAPKTKAGGDKKKKNKSAKVDQDDGSEDESAVITITKDVKNLKIANKSKKGKKKDSDDETDDLPVSKSKKKSGFDLLMMDDDDNDDEEQPVQATELDEDEDDEKPNKRQNKKGKKSKKKRNDSDDEDIDKVLAELESEYAGGKKPEVVAAVDPDELAEEFNEKKNKKGKKQAAKETQPETADVEDEPADDEEAGGGLKTAAQKKKEKKERQKREAALLKQQQHTQTSEAPNEDGETAEVPAPKASKAPKKIKEVKEEPKPEGVVEPAAEQPEEEKDDKKKKKKKTKAEIAAEKEEKEREKKKTGGLSKSVVAAMQERVKKMKEEEEKLRQEEEDRIAREEEMETARLERIRLEAEKKEKKKQKEAERKARLKAEGKLLTPKQKLDRARAQAMLDALRAQGAELPEVGEKRVRPGTRIRPNRKKDQQQANGVEDGKEESGENKDATTDQQKDDKIEEPVEVIKEAWDESSSSEEDEGEEESQEKDEDDEESESGDESDGSDDDSDDSDEDDEDDHRNEVEDKRERALLRIQKRRHDAELKRTVDNLRAAVVCVLGHVDTGKTKILDKLRRTNVQDGEAGGITQQIGATNVPIENIKEQCRIVKGSNDTVYRLPGLLIIDTPGHESFSNLRNRGSSLCDIAILVVDIMHGLEPQTIESLNLLKAKKTPFIVALNKIDRLYDWQTMSRKDVRDILRLQAANTQLEFKQRSKEVILQFAEQGLNAALFHENEDPKTYISMVPTSAITGEGMGNLLHLIVENCQNMLAKRLMYSEELQATVLEVKAIPGLGTTIDAILINGRLREGDTMILAGTEGPIVTQIRSLLMPQPMKELRVKNAYVEYKEIMAAQGVKIAAKELEKAIAGLNLQIAQKPDETEICREEVAKDLRSVLNSIKLTERGVYVQASTLGSLEALIEFLKTSKIPYAGIRIGPVVKRDVMKASTMLVHDPTFATILAFDVKIERDAQDMADSLGVKIFQADIIYHLFDKFIAYKDELLKKKRDEFRSIAVFPCKMKILPNFIFNSRDPIVMGVMIENGIVKEGTPICVPSKEFVDIGIVTSIELNHKQIDSARKGQEVCIKIEPIPGESPKMFGRHFDETDMLTSKISRQSIDACKDYFRDDLLKADWALMVELKKLFQIL